MSADFEIKFLSGKTLIMVEARGFDSEIFIPRILDGRICLLNVVNQRRCCPITQNDFSIAAEKARPLSTSYRMNIVDKKLNFNSVPMANSTPAKRNSMLATPEIVRRAAVQDENVQFATPQLGPGIKVVRLHRNPTKGTPQKSVAKVISRPIALSPMGNSILCNNQSQNRFSIIDNVMLQPPSFGSFDLMPPPPSTPLIHHSFLTKPATPGTSTKWRKCITPVRTYSRRSQNRVKSIQKQIKQTPRLKNGRRIPDYMRNPTVGVKSNPVYVIKRVKTIIDTKLTISPKSFKNQIKTARDDLNGDEFFLPRTKEQLHRKQFTAFDLITLPYKNRCMAERLKGIFRDGCIKKNSTTDARYKKLVRDIPPLEGMQYRKRLEFSFT